MQVWIRQADYIQHSRENEWLVEHFCPLCPCDFPDSPNGSDFMDSDFLNGGARFLWVVQSCEHLKDDEGENYEAGDFVPMQFIELSPYDNYTGSEI